MTLKKTFLLLFITLTFTNLAFTSPAYARIKLVTLPDRENTTVRLDNPLATLVEEERILNLHKGINKVDFSWKGVLRHNPVETLLGPATPLKNSSGSYRRRYLV